MEPIDYRNETWNSLTERLTQNRLAVWDAWKKHGPGTTREVARRAGIDILHFRPRTTELYQLGFVELVPNQPTGPEGVYQAISYTDAQRNFIAKKRVAAERQMSLL